MYNINHQKLIDLYRKQCLNEYSSRDLYPNYYVNKLENNVESETGFIRLNIFSMADKSNVGNETITIYVTDGEDRSIPIMHLITTLNPVRVELPIAYELGTQIEGPDYSFSTYDIRVDAFGYFSENIYNVRLFPGTTVDFDIGLISVTQTEAIPEIEGRTDIPPHLRDVIEE